jgi:RND superfamily putative drug exporter
LFEALGAAIYRHRRLTLGATGVFLAASIALLVRGGELTGGTLPGLESAEAEAIAAEITGRPADTTFVALFTSERGGALLPGMRAALAPLAGDPRVVSVASPADLPPEAAAAMLTPNASTGFALVTLQGDVKQALQAYPEVRAKLTSPDLAIRCTGKVPFLHDLGEVLEHDLARAELFSLPLALLVLLFVFRSVVAAMLPIGVGGLAVAGGIALVLSLSRVTEIAAYTVNVCSLIGLGLAIDYSLFTVARYREELDRGLAPREALVRAVGRAGRVVAFSGLSVAIGLSGLMFFWGSYLMAMGIGGALVVALAVLFALTFLPALLAVLGTRIDAGRLPFRNPPSESGFWHRLAGGVMRRPLRVLVPTLAVLLTLSLPVRHLRLEAADARVLPAATEARQGYDLLARDFPDRASSSLVVAVRFPSAPALTPPRIGALYDLSRRIAALPHVRQVESVVDFAGPLPRPTYEQLLTTPPPQAAAALRQVEAATVGRDAVLLNVVTDAGPESAAARHLVASIRAGRAVADGRLEVGGPVAGSVDATAYILGRAPYAIGFVVVVMGIVLFWMLRSVLLPLKAVLMNSLSISAAFGALVFVFQEGHLFISAGRPLEPSLPVILFCTLFGLSMDYEILMLSRIKEAWDETGDNTLAVAVGLEKTGRLITSAAAIMIAVFSAFALARVVLIQAVGFGMAVAVLLDATLVRVLLVPSTMRLLGRFNWWAPRRLRRGFRRGGGAGP